MLRRQSTRINNEEERSIIRNRAGKFYELRNAIVHGDPKAKNDKQLILLLLSMEGYLFRAINKQLRQEALFK